MRVVDLLNPQPWRPSRDRCTHPRGFAGEYARVPFVGSEAIARGRITRGELRSRFTAIHPDVYVERGVQRTLTVNAHAAALWAKDAIVTGRACCGLYGVQWVDATIPVELVGYARRPRPGVIVRNQAIAADEVSTIGGIRVVTAARAALDVARHVPRVEAVAYLDALVATTGVQVAAIDSLTNRYAGARGVRRARSVLALVDSGAQSPKETWLRLLIVDAGFPKPRCQIKVRIGYSTAYVDLGWEDLRIGLEYDGQQHLSMRKQYVRDIGRYELLAAQGWTIIRVVKEHSRAYILQRVRDAFADRSP